MDKQRRKFLKGAGIISASALLPACATIEPTDPPPPDPNPPQPDPDPDPDPAPNPDPDPDPRPGPDPGPVPQLQIRKDIASMAANDPTLVAYQNAITAMKALPASDPRSWVAQAKIHEDFCPHGNWFFLPWHRAYLHRFEAICRELSGDSNFALPYWDWSNSPQLPASFLGTDNPLNDASRQANASDIASSASIGSDVISNLLEETEFEIFGSGEATELRPATRNYGPLEQNPHNYIHGFVGGNMGRVPSAGLDPLFWCHHANIDRIWAQWNADGKSNSTNSDWLSFDFNGHFVASDGSVASVNVQDTLSLAALGYTYTGIPATPALIRAAINLSTPPERATFGSLNQTPSVLNEPLSIPVRNQGSFLKQASQAQALPRGVSSQRIYAVIGKIEAPMNEQLTVRVFVNGSNLSASTPTTDPHYAGSFAFFASSHTGSNHHASTLAFNIEITKTIERLSKLGEIDESNLKIQLLPVGLPGRDTKNTRFIARRIDIQYR